MEICSLIEVINAEPSRAILRRIHQKTHTTKIKAPMREKIMMKDHIPKDIYIREELYLELLHHQRKHQIHPEAFPASS